MDSTAEDAKPASHQQTWSCSTLVDLTASDGTAPSSPILIATLTRLVTQISYLTADFHLTSTVVLSCHSCQHWQV